MPVRDERLFLSLLVQGLVATNRTGCPPMVALVRGVLRWRRFISVLVLLLCAFGGVGCDYPCDLLICNFSSDRVEFDTNGLDVWHKVESCQVLMYRFPSIARPLRVRVRNASGQVVYEEALEPTKNPVGFPQVEVRIPGDSSGTCPAKLPGRHMLEVWNGADQPVMAMLDGEDIGTVEPNSTRAFGPYDHELTYIPHTTFRDPDGNFEYVLGCKERYYIWEQLPVYRVCVISDLMMDRRRLPTQ